MEHASFHRPLITGGLPAAKHGLPAPASMRGLSMTERLAVMAATEEEQKKQRDRLLANATADQVRGFLRGDLSIAKVQVKGYDVGDYLERLKMQAAQCLPGFVPTQNNCGPCGPNGQQMDPRQLPPQNPQQPPRNPYTACNVPIRDVSVGGSNPAQIAALGAWTITATPLAPFLPVFVTINAAQAQNVIVNSISYGPTSMLIGGINTGDNFSTANNQGGYRLPTKTWLMANTPLTATGTAIAAIAASNLLIVEFFGFTTAPG